FLLRFRGGDADLNLDLTDKPEFDSWRWVDFWYPMAHVVTFKRSVYARALSHLAPFARAVAGLDAVPHPADDLLSVPGRTVLIGERRRGSTG
ncbi:MAG: RNA pyrophosphohydrolase, partial [Thermomonas sp.]